jgi:protein-tyrosine phosphatase
VLVDGRENVWIIDWFHARRAHALMDVAKLENDLLYLFTTLADEEELAQAVRLTVALRRVEDLRQPLGAPPPGVVAPTLLRAWEVLRQLRAVVARLCREDRDPRQLRVALLRYAAHTLSFDEASPLQKRWALASACALAEDVVRGAHPARLRVDWIAPDDLPTSGRLGLTICPGRRDRGRQLSSDLASLAEDGATDLVCLLPAHEMEWLGVPDLREAAQARGLRFHHLPIRDQGVPSLQEATDLLDVLSGRLEAGARVVVHCMGGLGRSGTIAACAVARHGKVGAHDAILAVRRARDPRAVETIEQERFVASYVGERGHGGPRHDLSRA